MTKKHSQPRKSKEEDDGEDEDGEGELAALTFDIHNCGRSVAECRNYPETRMNPMRREEVERARATEESR